jgi:hypothetical protein
MESGIVPLPTGLDVANTLRYFNQLLLGKKKKKHKIRNAEFIIIDIPYG